MAIVFPALFLVALIAARSTTHALGAWLVLLLTHGFIINTFGSGATHLPMVAGLVILFILLLKKDITSIHMKSLGLFLGLIGLMLVSAFAGMDIQESLPEIAGYAKGMFLAAVIATVIRDVEQIRTLSIYCLSALVFGTCVTVYQHFTGSFSIDAYNTQRASSLDIDPNVTAMLLCSGFSIALHWIYQSKSNYSTLLLVGSIFMLIVGVALTGSRGGFVAMLIVISILFWRKPSLVFAVCGILMIIGVAAVAPKSTIDRLETLVTGQEVRGGGSIGDRANMVKDGIIIFADNPLLGVGPGNFPRARFALLGERSRAAAAIASRQPEFGKRAHNMYLEFFVENGIIAGSLFLYILLVPIRGLLRLDKYSPNSATTGGFGIGFSMAMAISALLIGCLFLSEAKNAVLWFLIGIGFSSTQIIRNYIGQAAIPRSETTLQSLKSQ
jgi:O-antigen ligase